MPTAARQPVRVRRPRSVGIHGDKHRLGLGDGRNELAQLAGEVVAEVLLGGLRQDGLVADGADAVREGVAGAVDLPLQPVRAPPQGGVHVGGELADVVDGVDDPVVLLAGDGGWAGRGAGWRRVVGTRTHAINEAHVLEALGEGKSDLSTKLRANARWGLATRARGMRSPTTSRTTA
jgi:hypothetical protein